MKYNVTVEWLTHRNGKSVAERVEEHEFKSVAEMKKALFEKWMYGATITIRGMPVPKNRFLHYVTDEDYWRRAEIQEDRIGTRRTPLQDYLSRRYGRLDR